MPVERTLPTAVHLENELAIVEGADYWHYIDLWYLDESDGQEKTWVTTGYSAEMTIRQTYDSEILMYTTEAGYLTVGDPDWTLIIHLPDTVTGATGAGTLGELEGRGVYDIRLIDSFGHVTPIRDGHVAVRRKVSP